MKSILKVEVYVRKDGDNKNGDYNKEDKQIEVLKEYNEAALHAIGYKKVKIWEKYYPSDSFTMCSSTLIKSCILFKETLRFSIWFFKSVESDSNFSLMLGSTYDISIPHFFWLILLLSLIT